jgi:hypothetical protein
MVRTAMLVAVLAAFAPRAASALANFPGAEGFGSETPGGRGGAVLFVDNLNDSGPGSLRAAVQASGPRIVVFRVGGTITLESPLVITQPYLTIAGQTAPGDGIQIRNDPVSPYGHADDSFTSIVIQTHDVVIRYLRIRPGPLEPNPACTGANAVPSPYGWSTCNSAGDIQAIQLEIAAYNVVLDHLSLAWVSDSIVSLLGATDVTLQWTILSEAMNYILYQEFWPSPKPWTGTGILTGDHTSAGVQGEVTGRLSMHHNLWSSSNARLPQLTNNCYSAADPSVCVADVVNNLVYNWGIFATLSQNLLGHHFHNAVGNYYKPGPDTTAAALQRAMEIDDLTNSLYTIIKNAALGVYHSDNRLWVAPSQTTDVPVLCTKWNKVLNQFQACDPASYAMPHFTVPAVATSSAEIAYDTVLADAGVSHRIQSDGRWAVARDATDTRVVSEVQTGAGAIIDSYAEFPGWPSLVGAAAPADADQDGMPDAFEQRYFLLPSDPVDGPQDFDGDGWTNVEEYLNGTNPRKLPGQGGCGLGFEVAPLLLVLGRLRRAQRPRF